MSGHIADICRSFGGLFLVLSFQNVCPAFARGMLREAECHLYIIIDSSLPHGWEKLQLVDGWFVRDVGAELLRFHSFLFFSFRKFWQRQRPLQDL